jgi:hypothetical protein
VVTSPTPVFVDDAKNRPLGGGQEFAKQEEAAALKREANDMKDGLASTTWALQETQAEEECLMGQVVLSPERRTQELAKKKERLEKKSGKRDKCQKIWTKTRPSLFISINPSRMPKIQRPFNNKF